ncbi:hypothetical protein [Arthrobacter sp. SD76]|uniref:hypothetical protein n=1 Tax=Arthrobacter sp. SD76 TaxID=3415007 RepID=UPI003C73F179
MAITVKVACPVCGARLEYGHAEPEAWGAVALTDQGCVEITAHDKNGVIREHMQGHHTDGTWAAAVRRHAEHTNALVKRLDELGK